MRIRLTGAPANLATSGVFCDPGGQATMGMFCDYQERPPLMTFPPAPSKVAQEVRDRRDLLDMLHLIVKSYG